MHIRVKRRNVTIFCEVQPDETVLEVKQRIQELTEKKPEEQKLVLDGVRERLLERVSVHDCALMLVVVVSGLCVCVRIESGREKRGKRTVSHLISWYNSTCVLQRCAESTATKSDVELPNVAALPLSIFCKFTHAHVSLRSSSSSSSLA